LGLCSRTLVSTTKVFTWPLLDLLWDMNKRSGE
jgi:hypothetical protein